MIKVFMVMKKKVTISFLIALVYVFIGTLVGISSLPKYFIFEFGYNHTLWLPLLIITLPSNFILFGLLMVSDSVLNILILQTLIFFIIWFLVNKMIIKKSN